MHPHTDQKLLTIGVVATPGDPQLGTVINGVSEVVRQHGGRVFNLAAPIENIGMPLPASDAIDGWVVVHWQEGVAALVASGRPVVTVNMAIDGLPCPTVLPDNTGGTYALIDHLIRLGHRRIAFLGDMRHKDVRDRYAGYLSALQDHQIPVDPAIVLEGAGADDAIVCRKAFQKVIDPQHRCTAIFAGHDYNAQRLIQLAHQHGYRVPEDLAVVGFDDIETAQYHVPPLTTVRQQFVEHGRVAARLLFDLLAGRPQLNEVITVPTAMVVRRSCGAQEQTSAPVAPMQRSALAFLPNWPEVLSRQLVEALRYPLVVPAATPPEQIWPGVSRIGQVLARMVAAEAVERIDELDSVWAFACQSNPLLSNILAILETIEDTCSLIVQHHRDAAIAAGLTALVREMRLRFLWHYQVYSNNASSQTTHVAEVYQWAVTTLLDPQQQAEQLGWIEHTNDRWACFARWENGPQSQRVRIVGVYPHTAPQQALIGQTMAVTQFPPLATLPATVQQGEHLLKILPVQTARSYWGLLAVCGPIEPRLYSPTLAQILGTVIDNHALQLELTDQQDTLREAYERERGLAETVRAIGSPVIPILQGVLLVPLVGAIDAARAQQIIERVLEGVNAEQAEIVLLDLTGVPLVDSHVASSLVQTARAVTLLGAEVLLVGIRPEIAQSIIGLGLDLQQIRTFSSLAVALQSLRRRLSA
ncbi:MAG: hypothetical protein Fur005_40040 [Roseiflexaceae bacterium]